MSMRDTLGWTTYKKSKDTDILNNKIKENIDILQAMGCLQPSTYTIQNEHLNELITFHIIDNCAHNENMTVVHNSSSWDVGHTCVNTIWKCVCLDEDECCSNDFSRTTTYFSHNRVECNTSTTKFFLDSRDKMQCVSLENRYMLREARQHIGRMKVHTFKIFTNRETTHVYFHPGVDVDNIHEKADISCVNACYTGSVSGNMKMLDSNSGERVNYFHVAEPNGPCGGLVIKCISLGIVQIFNDQNGIRKVTCKAFCSRTDADMMLDMINEQFGLKNHQSLVPHMMVMFGYTGSQIDISNNGYIQQIMTKYLKGFEFVSIIEEVNNHIVFRWNSLFEVYETVVKNTSRDPFISTLKQEAHEHLYIAHFLRDVKLCMSITCRGTCIYRVGIVSGIESIPIHIFADALFENLIIQMCSYVHYIVSN